MGFFGDLKNEPYCGAAVIGDAIRGAAGKMSGRARSTGAGKAIEDAVGGMNHMVGGKMPSKKALMIGGGGVALAAEAIHMNRKRHQSNQNYGMY